MPAYAVEVITLPLTAGQKKLTEVYGIDAPNFAAAVAAVQQKTGATPDQTVHVKGHIAAGAAKLLGITSTAVVMIYAEI